MLREWRGPWDLSVSRGTVGNVEVEPIGSLGARVIRGSVGVLSSALTSLLRGMVRPGVGGEDADLSESCIEIADQKSLTRCLHKSFRLVGLTVPGKCWSGLV